MTLPVPPDSGTTNAPASCARLVLGLKTPTPEIVAVWEMTSRPLGELAGEDAPSAADTIVMSTVLAVGLYEMVEKAPASSWSIAARGAMKTRRRTGSLTETWTAGEVAVTVPPNACQPKSGWLMMKVPVDTRWALGVDI